MSEDSGPEYEDIDMDESGVPSISNRPPMPLPVPVPSPAPRPPKRINNTPPDPSRANFGKPASPPVKYDTLPSHRKNMPARVAVPLPGIPSRVTNEAPPSVFAQKSREGRPPPVAPKAARPSPPPPPKSRFRFASADDKQKKGEPPINGSHPMVKVNRSKTIGCPGDLPPLPPKPLPKADSFSYPEPQQKRKFSRSISQEYLVDSEELTLKQLVDKYQEQFPLPVRVCKGFYGSSDRTSVSEGDAFNIHFVKKSKVVNISDSNGGQYKIAMNSAIEFGVLYNPNNDIKSAQKGFYFEKISDILATKVIPRAIRATQAWKGSGPDSSVDANELLLVVGTRNKLKTKYLKVYSPAANVKKTLPEQCFGKFSTRPYDVRLYLPEIMHHLKHPLPLQAVLFVNSEISQDLPPYLMSSVVSLTSQSVETSLVATSTLNDDITQAQLIDIPFDLDIEVQVMSPKDTDETQQLYHDTRTLLETFDPTRLCPYLNSTTADAYDAQAAFYNIIREGKELDGVDLVKPSRIYVNLSILEGDPFADDSPPPTPKREQTLGSQISVTSSSAEDILEEVKEAEKKNEQSLSSQISVTSSSTEDILEEVKEMEKKNEDLENRMKSMEATLKKLQHLAEIEGDITKVGRDITSARADTKRMEGRVIKASEEITRIKTDLGHMVPSLERVVKWCEEMQGEIKELQSRIPAANAHAAFPLTPTSPLTPQSISETACERNRKYLAGLDTVQMIHLLDAMGLKQHHETFMKERISGEILVECDDQVLEKELKITSKLHRVRLLKLIAGRHSAESIMKGDDPYVYASKSKYQ